MPSTRVVFVASRTANASAPVPEPTSSTAATLPTSEKSTSDGAISLLQGPNESGARIRDNLLRPILGRAPHPPQPEVPFRSLLLLAICGTGFIQARSGTRSRDGMSVSDLRSSPSGSASA